MMLLLPGFGLLFFGLLTILLRRNLLAMTHGFFLIFSALGFLFAFTGLLRHPEVGAVKNGEAAALIILVLGIFFQLLLVGLVDRYRYAKSDDGVEGEAIDE